MTNFDKITKTKEELARFIANVTDGCHKCPAYSKCGKYGGKNCMNALTEWMGE